MTTQRTGTTTPEPELDAKARRLADQAEQRLNGLAKEAGSKYEQVADYLVETVFDGDTLTALQPGRASPPAFRELLRRADVTLQFSADMLVKAAKVGALNRHLAEGDWRTLGWSVKVALLPLVSGGELGPLREGLRWVVRHQAGVRATREWVYRRTGAESDDARTGPAPTMAASRKAFALGQMLGKAADRRRWLDLAEELPDEERAELLASLRAATRHFEKLLAEFEAALVEE